MNQIFYSRSFWLLAGQFLLLLAAAFMRETRFAEETFLVALSVVLIAGLYALAREARYRKLFVMIGFLTLAGNVSSYCLSLREADLVAAGTNLLFLGWIIYLLMRHVFMSGRADAETIMGAVSLYLVIGMAFGFIYMLVDYTIPHSFSIDRPDRSAGLGELISYFFYYSFVTLATVGYGDITPVGQAARYLSVIEALFAQLYLAILVARLVGLHTSARSDGK